MNYLDRAVGKLRAVGINFAVSDADQTPILQLLDKVQHYDNTKVTSIAVTLQQSSTFNAAIREQLQGMDISTRFADITTSFTSVREDAKAMVEWMADGKLDVSERLKLSWMNLRRGSIPDRFNDIRVTYLDVVKSCGEQIEIEASIISAYLDFRMALKSAEVEAQDVLQVATEALDKRKTELAEASNAVAAGNAEDLPAMSRLELARDAALMAVQDEDKCYQIAKDLADDLKVSYNAAELVFARLNQTHTVKERLRQRMISFFSTSETVLSGLSATFTSNSGLGEATNTMNAMSDEMGKSLESLATTGTDQLNAGLRAGYGATLKVDSVRALADSVGSFQESSFMLIDELRKESTATANEIAQVTESAKQRFSQLLAKGEQ